MYLIFSSECYYPSGGANDYIAQKDFLKDKCQDLQYIKELECD